MEPKCTCSQGPGKFEGEPVATFLSWEVVMNGFADEDIGRYSFVRFPLALDDYTIEQALEYGYCEYCIKECDKSAVIGMALWESETGFVYGEWLTTQEEWDNAVRVAEEEAAEEGEE